MKKIILTPNLINKLVTEEINKKNFKRALVSERKRLAARLLDIDSQLKAGE